MTELDCDNCGKRFRIAPSRMGKRRHCSKACLNEATKSKKNDPLTIEVIRASLAYDPLTGIMTRKTNSGGSKIGDRAGFPNPLGHIRVAVQGVQYFGHQLAWAHYYGVWPTNYIDHINGDPGDNRIDNLRLCTHAENCRNGKLRSSNSSGFKGVSFDKSRQKWNAEITHQRRKIHLGRYETREEAAIAYDAAAKKFHGEFARVNGLVPANS